MKDTTYENTKYILRACRSLVFMTVKKMVAPLAIPFLDFSELPESEKK